MEIFEITKVIFEQPNRWVEVSNLDKKRYFFILNRRFSIAHPLQAQALQHLKIDPVEVMDFWFRFLSKKYDKTPFWMYIKGVKKQEEEKQKKISVSKEAMKEYMRLNRLDSKTMEAALEFGGEEFIKELKIFEKSIKN